MWALPSRCNSDEMVSQVRFFTKNNFLNNEVWKHPILKTKLLATKGKKKIKFKLERNQVSHNLIYFSGLKRKLDFEIIWFWLQMYNTLN